MKTFIVVLVFLAVGSSAPVEQVHKIRNVATFEGEQRPLAPPLAQIAPGPQTIYYPFPDFTFPTRGLPFTNPLFPNYPCYPFYPYCGVYTLPPIVITVPRAAA